MQTSELAHPVAPEPAPSSLGHSVIIPVFNAERTIAGTIQSVLDQTVADFEVIVVDDGSRDGSAAVVEAIDDERVRLVRQENGGLSAARNTGLGLARGELISFIDHDDLWMPRYLESMSATLEGDPQAGVAYCDAWLFEDGTGRVNEGTFMEVSRPMGTLPTDPKEFFLVHLQRNFIYVGATVRRSVLAQVGGFCEDLTHLQDYELWLRIELAGWGLAEVPDPLALYRLSEGQMSEDNLSLARDLIHVCDLLDAQSLPAAAKPLLAKRRLGAEREVKALSGASSLLRLRRQLRAAWRTVARVGEQAGRSMKSPPPSVAATFPDLADL